MDSPNNESSLENSDLKKWERLKGVGRESGSQEKMVVFKIEET